jgi:precorrin-6Y C5,15-methyltransferase (decarboxylating)
MKVPSPIFIGGGAGRAEVLDVAIAALRSGGRLVANAVTLATEAALIARHAARGGELIRIAISRAEPLSSPLALVGRGQGDGPPSSRSLLAGEGGGERSVPVVWRPALPVTQWVWVKP